jgi:hypothetical protein
VKEFGSVVVSRPMVREITRVIIAVIAIFLLLTPIIGLNVVQRTLFKFIIIFVASTIFIVSISTLSKASIDKVFAGGAAYAAVMVV